MVVFTAFCFLFNSVVGTTVVKRVWTDPPSCLREFDPFTLHAAGENFSGSDKVVLVRSGDECGDPLARVATSFMPCFMEEDGTFAGIGIFKLLCPAVVEEVGSFRPCFCSALLSGGHCESLLNFGLSAENELDILILPYSKYASNRYALPPSRKLLGQSTISAVASGPAGSGVENLVVGGGLDGYVRLWDRESGLEVWSERHVFGGSVPGVWEVAWSRNGSEFASAGSDGRALIWNLSEVLSSQGQRRRCLNWEPVWVKGAGETERQWQGRILGYIANASTSYAETLNTSGLEFLKNHSSLTHFGARQMCDVACTEFRGNAKLCFCGVMFDCQYSQTCAPKCGGFSGEVKHSLSLSVRAVRFSPFNDVMLTGGEDGIICLWAKNGSSSASPKNAWLARACVMGGCEVSGLSFRSDGFAFSSSCNDGRVKLYFISHVTYEIREVFEDHTRRQTTLSDGSVGVEWSKDGRYAVTGGGDGLSIWDVLSGERVSNWRVHPPYSRGLQSEQVLSLALSPDDAWLAVRTLDKVLIYDFNQSSYDQRPVAERGFWEALSTRDFLDESSVGSRLSWSIARLGPPRNVPFASVDSGFQYIDLKACYPREAVTALSDITLEMRCEAISGELPVLSVEILLPFAFTQVEGSFKLRSVGLKKADDCRPSQPPISEWTSQEDIRWTRAAKGMVAVGSDCRRILGTAGDVGSYSHNFLECKQACEKQPLCNLINFLEATPGGLTPPQTKATPEYTGDFRLRGMCDLRRCESNLPAQLSLAPKEGYEAWGLHRVTADRIPGSGYVAFGTEEEVLHGGCSSTSGIPFEAEGVTVDIPRTFLDSPQTFIKFQAAQTNAEETVRIFDISLSFFRPMPTPVRVADEPLVGRGRSRMQHNNLHSASPVEAATSVGHGLSFSSDGGYLIGSAFGRAAGIWDVRGLYLANQEGKPYWKASIPLPGSSTFKATVKNFPLGRQLDISFLGVDLSLSSRMRISEAKFCGEPSSDEHGEGVLVPVSSPERWGTNGLVWRNVTIGVAGDFAVCWCDMAPASCCDSAPSADWAGGLAGRIIVAGPFAAENYFVCSFDDPDGCVITSFQGSGLAEGDQIMLLQRDEGTNECGRPGMIPIQYWATDNAIMTSRGDGMSYKTEVQDINGFYSTTIVSHPLMVGMTLLMCWCRPQDPAVGCGTNADSFSVFGGLLLFARLSVDAADAPSGQLICQQRLSCIVTLSSSSAPLSPGDVLMVKTGSDTSCQGSAVSTIGNQGKSVACTSLPCLTYDFGVVSVSVPVQVFRVCFCQGSLRACVSASEYEVDIGTALEVQETLYIFPEKCNPVGFVSWRGPPWTSFHDCCCNFQEAGASPGCEDTTTEVYATCSNAAYIDVTLGTR